MVLVLFFAIVLVIFILTLLCIIFSHIQIKIENLEISNIELDGRSVSHIKKGVLNTKYKFVISLYFLNRIKWISINLNNIKIRKIYRKMHLDRIDIKKLEKDFSIAKFKELIKIKPNIKKLDLQINLGLKNVITVSYIIPIICTVLSIILTKYVEKRNINNIKYEVNPIYNRGNVYYISLNTLVNFRMLDILETGIRMYKISKNEKEKKQNKEKNLSRINCHV